MKFGENSCLVILTIIYVNLCNCLLSPSSGGNNLHLYVNLYLNLCNCILFSFFSSFYWGRAKFNKFDCILALCMFICVYNLELFKTY